MFLTSLVNMEHQDPHAIAAGEEEKGGEVRSQPADTGGGMQGEGKRGRGKREMCGGRVERQQV